MTSAQCYRWRHRTVNRQTVRGFPVENCWSCTSCNYRAVDIAAPVSLLVPLSISLSLYFSISLYLSINVYLSIYIYIIVYPVSACARVPVQACLRVGVRARARGQCRCVCAVWRLIDLNAWGGDVVPLELWPVQFIITTRGAGGGVAHPPTPSHNLSTHFTLHILYYYFDTEFIIAIKWHVSREIESSGNVAAHQADGYWPAEWIKREKCFLFSSFPIRIKVCSLPTASIIGSYMSLYLWSFYSYNNRIIRNLRNTKRRQLRVFKEYEKRQSNRNKTNPFNARVWILQNLGVHVARSFFSQARTR